MFTTRWLDFFTATSLVLVSFMYTHINLKDCIEFKQTRSQNNLKWQSFSFWDRVAKWMVNAVIFGVVLMISYRAITTVWDLYRYQEEYKNLKENIERLKQRLQETSDSRGVLIPKRKCEPERNQESTDIKELKDEIRRLVKGRLEEFLKRSTNKKETKGKETQERPHKENIGTKDEADSSEGDKKKKYKDKSEQRNGLLNELKSARRKLRPGNIDEDLKVRPEKIAADFKNLYETEWMAALKSFNEAPESKDDTIKILLEVLKDISSSCNQHSHNEKKEIVEYLRKQQDTNEVKKGLNKHQIQGEVNKLQSSKTKDAITTITESILTRNPEFANNDARRKYVECSVRLCRLMSIQAQPMTLDFGPEQNADINYNSFKPYQSTGKKMNYTVWPALYMNKPHRLMSQGVVEPIARRAIKQ